MDIKRKVKIICANKGMTQKEIAKIHGDNYQVWINKLRRNTMQFSEAERIFNELGCRIAIIDKETKKEY